MKFLVVEHILELHVLVLNETGGGQGLRDLDRLESVIASQHQEVFGQELYKTIFDKAAALCRGIVADHPFVDGNKRTAMLTSLTFLKINGYNLKSSQKELEDFAVRVAVERLDIPVIAAWFKTHCQKR